MSKRVWGATGVGEHDPRRFSDDDRGYIFEVVRKLGSSDFDGFIEELDASISRFRSFGEISDSSRPAAIKHNLNKCLKNANLLAISLNELDGNSLQILQEVSSLKILFQSHEVNLKTLREACNVASQYAGKHSGRLRDPRSLWLAVDILDSFEQYYGRLKATTSTNGPYVELLAIIFELAFGKSLDAPEYLASKALKYRHHVKKKNSAGSFEYCPPPSNEIK